MTEVNKDNDGVKLSWTAPELIDLSSDLDRVRTQFNPGTDASAGGFATSMPS